MKKRDIDLKDIEILNTLQENALLSNKDLAKAIGLSEGPTLVRVQHLFKKGAIIRYIALINLNYFSYSAQLLANVRILKEKSAVFIEKVRDTPQVLRCFQIESSDQFELAVNEYLLTIYGKSHQECKKLLDDLMMVDERPVAVQQRPYTVKEIIKDEFLKLTPKDVR